MIFSMISKGALRIGKLVASHSTEVLGGVAIVSMGGAVVSAIKAAPKCEKIKEAKERAIDNIGTFNKDISDEECKARKAKIYKRYLKDMAVNWFPTVAFTAISAVSVVSIVKISSKKQAALAAALSLADERLQNYEKYEEKVKETLGPKKEQKIQDDVLKEYIQNNPPVSITETGHGSVLCLDKCSGRYFRSSPEFIRQVEGNLNKRISNEMYISLNELYFELDLPSIDVGDEVGWNLNRDGWIDLDPKSSLTNEDIPVYVLNFRVKPRSDYKITYR